jgi:hypothetical protein
VVAPLDLDRSPEEIEIHFLRNMGLGHVHCCIFGDGGRPSRPKRPSLVLLNIVTTLVCFVGALYRHARVRLVRTPRGIRKILAA